MRSLWSLFFLFCITFLIAEGRHRHRHHRPPLPTPQPPPPTPQPLPPCPMGARRTLGECLFAAEEGQDCASYCGNHGLECVPWNDDKQCSGCKAMFQNHEPVDACLQTASSSSPGMGQDTFCEYHINASEVQCDAQPPSGFRRICKCNPPASQLDLAEVLSDDKANEIVQRIFGVSMAEIVSPSIDHALLASNIVPGQDMRVVSTDHHVLAFGAFNSSDRLFSLKSNNSLSSVTVKDLGLASAKTIIDVSDDLVNKTVLGNPNVTMISSMISVLRFDENGVDCNNESLVMEIEASASSKPRILVLNDDDVIDNIETIGGSIKVLGDNLVEVKVPSNTVLLAQPLKLIAYTDDESEQQTSPLVARLPSFLQEWIKESGFSAESWIIAFGGTVLTVVVAIALISSARKEIKKRETFQNPDILQEIEEQLVGLSFSNKFSYLV